MDKKIIILFLVLGIILSGCKIDEGQTEEPIGTEEQETQEPVGETGEGAGESVEEEVNETTEPEVELNETGETEEEVNATEPEENVLTIEIDHLTLSQKYVTIEKGTTVVWINKENHPHIIAPHHGDFRSPRLEQGDSYNYTFNEIGEYTYICAIFQSYIRGTINVEENP